MAFTNGVSGYMWPGWAEVGTPQAQADEILARIQGANQTGMDSSSGTQGNWQEVATYFFGPQNTAQQNIDPCAIATQLPRSGTGFIGKSNTSPSRQFATGPTIFGVEAFAEDWAATHPDTPLRIGEISIQGGGLFGEHKGTAHSEGLGVDIGLFRNDGKDQGTTYGDTVNYNKALTTELVNALQNFPGVSRLIFDDPSITGLSKLTRDKNAYDGRPIGTHVHDNHVHVEFVNPCQRK